MADAMWLVTRREECSEEVIQRYVDEAWRRLEHAAEETMWRALRDFAARHEGEPEWEAVRRRGREAAKGRAEVTTCSPLRRRGHAEDNFALRKARNVLSMADAYMQAPDGSAEKANLLGKLRRRGVTGGIAAQRHGLTSQVEAEELRLRRGRISAWKEKMKDFRAASAYLRGPSAPRPMQICDADTGAAAQVDVMAMLGVLREHWKRVWDRPDPYKEDGAQRIRCTLQARPEEQWKALEAEDFRRAAARQRHRAAGPDGWTGSEVAQLPEEWWETAAPLFQTFETVMSSWWRMMAAARMRSAETSQWAARVAPPSAYGGVAGRSAHDAVEALLQIRRSQGFASWRKGASSRPTCADKSRSSASWWMRGARGPSPRRRSRGSARPTAGC